MTRVTIYQLIVSHSLGVRRRLFGTDQQCCAPADTAWGEITDLKITTCMDAYQSRPDASVRCIFRL